MAVQISDEQKAKYRKIFDHYDLNKDGELEADELAKASKDLGYKLSMDDIISILNAMDDAGKGSLNFDQFVQAIFGNKTQIPDQEHWKAELRSKFMEYDADNSGFIDEDEAKLVLGRDLGFSEKQSVDLVKKYDVNGDGKLSYEEFVDFYSKVKEKKEAMHKAFKQFDKSGTGNVNLDDAKRILGGFMGLTDDEIATLINTHDTNKDGNLQYDEFTHFWNA